MSEKTPDEFEEIGVINGAKRLGVQWCPWMGDWFTSWSPRNGNSNAEGTWQEWANLAALILKHPFTERVSPQLYRPDLPAEALYTTAPTLADGEIRKILEPPK